MIQLYNSDGKELPFDAFTFPGGEPHVKLQDTPAMKNGVYHIVFRPKGFHEFGTLLVLNDALRRNQWMTCIDLHIPYFPGARQDRVTSKQEPFTLKVMADLINSMNFIQVTVLDPHSDVLPALVKSIKVLEPAPYVEKFVKYLPYKLDGLICPDAGAQKRTEAIARHLKLPVIYAHKHRDLETGKLSGFSCEPLPSMFGHYLVVDDICDGGGTFNGLAGAIDPHNEKRHTLDLFVSHGIFSNGLEKLFTNFNMIGTTDSIEHIGPRFNYGKLIEISVDSVPYAFGKE